MDVPDPTLAQDVADALTGLADDVEGASVQLAVFAAELATRWHGHAAGAAEQLVLDLAATSAEASDGVRGAAATWSGLAGRLRSVQAKVEAVNAISTGAAVWGVVSLVQGGLDPFTDLAAGGEEAAAQGALAGARKLLADVVRDVVVKAATDRAVLAALAKLYVAESVVGVAKTAVTTAALEQLETGHVHVADVLSPTLALALVPGPLQPLVTVAQSIDPAAPGRTPPCFPDRDSYLAAVDAADDWAAATPGVEVAVTAGPDGGVRLEVYGPAGLRTGSPEDGQQLVHDDPGLAALLQALTRYAQGRPVTVVAH